MLTVTSICSSRLCRLAVRKWLCPSASWKFIGAAPGSFALRSPKDKGDDGMAKPLPHSETAKPRKIKANIYQLVANIFAIFSIAEIRQ
jgi:hypothetical protein